MNAQTLTATNAATAAHDNEEYEYASPSEYEPDGRIDRNRYVVVFRERRPRAARNLQLFVEMRH